MPSPALRLTQATVEVLRRNTAELTTSTQPLVILST
jgi:hypothetical protein